MPRKPPTHKPAALLLRHSVRKQQWKPRTREQQDARTLRSSHRWQRFRAWILRRFPLCMALGCPRVTPADQVHHIIPLVEDMTLAFVWRNTVPLCTACHAHVEQRERQGIEARLEFNQWWERDDTD